MWSDSATVADPTANPTITVIGGASSGSGSPVLPPGQSYRDNAPVQPTGSSTTVPQPTMNGTGDGSMGGNQLCSQPAGGSADARPLYINRWGNG